MKKKTLIPIIIIIAIAVPLIYFWPTLSILTEGNSRYSENDSRRYELLTDDIIKNCPRISSDYDFGYATIDGPAKEISNITFKNTTDATKIRNYLTNLGFHLDYSDSSGEYWKSIHSDKAVHIGVVVELKTTIVDVIKK